MKNKCIVCGKEFETIYPSKIYCSETCKYYNREKKTPKDYKYVKEFAEPLAVFHCKWCGRRVEIWNKDDQRRVYCCGSCKAAWRKLRAANYKRLQYGLMTEEEYEEFLKQKENVQCGLKQKAEN